MSLSLYRLRRAALAGIMLAIIPMARLLGQPGSGDGASGCLLHDLTGHPCPFCGLTRALNSATHGDWSAAAAFHPLWWMAGFAILIVAALAIRDACFGTDSFTRIRTIWRKTPWYLPAGILVAAALLRSLC